MTWKLLSEFFPEREKSLILFSHLMVLRFGRRNTLLVSYTLTTVFGFSSAFANSYTMFAVLRFFTGVSITGIGIISLILGKFPLKSTSSRRPVAGFNLNLDLAGALGGRYCWLVVIIAWLLLTL